MEIYTGLPNVVIGNGYIAYDVSIPTDKDKNVSISIILTVASLI